MYSRVKPGGIYNSYKLKVPSTLTYPSKHVPFCIKYLIVIQPFAHHGSHSNTHRSRDLQRGPLLLKTRGNPDNFHKITSQFSNVVGLLVKIHVVT